MNLKLADYGKTKKKFERFLKLGDFAYCGDHIFIWREDFLKTDLEFYKVKNGNKIEGFWTIYLRDKTDPLNRFDGQFNGKTYGQGRFVLEWPSDNDVYLYREILNLGFPRGIKTIEVYRLGYGDKLLGNLHEDPKLWEKYLKSKKQFDKKIQKLYA